MRQLCRTDLLACACRPAFRSPADPPRRPRLAGEWASTRSCCRSSGTSPPTTGWPAIIESYLELLRRASAASSSASSRERAPPSSGASATARCWSGAQLGDGACDVRGGEWGGRGHGVDPPSGGGRSGVQKTSIPSCGAREHGPIFAACARFASREAATFALFGMVPLSQMSLPSCGDRSQNLTCASHTRADR